MKRAFKTLLALTLFAAAAAPAGAVTTSLNTGNWQGGAWSSGQPGIGDNAIITGNVAANGIVNTWNGDLTVNSGVVLTVSGNSADFIALAGANNIFLNGGTIINNMKTRTLSSNIILNGGGSLSLTSTGAFNQGHTYNGIVSGNGGLNVLGGNHELIAFTGANTFNGGLVIGTQNQRYAVGLGTGSAGAGDVTTNGVVGQQGPVLRLLGNAPFAPTATLNLNGSGFNNSTGGFGPVSFYVGTSFLLDLNGFNASVQSLFVNGVAIAPGTYAGGSEPWLGNRGTASARLTVTGAAVIVPEPATASLALIGLGGLMMRRRREMAI